MRFMTAFLHFKIDLRLISCLHVILDQSLLDDVNQKQRRPKRKLRFTAIILE